MVMSSPSKIIEASKSEVPPDSPCETVASSFSDASLVELATDPKRIMLRASSSGLFEDVVLDLESGIEFHGLNNIWSFCLGCAGFFDMAASLLPSFVDSFGHPGARGVNDTHGQYTLSPSIVAFATFLDRHNVAIGFLFSVLWFADAFVSAKCRENKFLLQEEKAQVLSVGDTSKSKNKWWQTARFVYLRTMLLQLLLLPVGFYYLFFYTIYHLGTGKALEDLDTVDASLAIAVANADHEIEYERFSTKSKISLLFAIVRHVLLKVSGSTTRHLRAQLSEFMRWARPAAVKKILSLAIRNPLQFRRDVQSLLRLIRWVKYLAPVVGTFNKLKGNVNDMMKKRKLRRIAKQLKRIKKQLWETKPVHVREEEAAMIIQNAYRAHKARKVMDALLASEVDKHLLATIKIQRALRASLARARRRNRQKVKELRRLSGIKLSKRKELDKEDTRRFYELQDELALEADKLINKKLLLRPSTRFAVVWKILFIICIAVEISQLIAKPWLDSYKSQRKGEPMTMSEFIALSFTPIRASQRPECGISAKRGGLLHSLPLKRNKKSNISFDDVDDLPWYCTPRGSGIQEAYSDAIFLLLVPAPVADWPDCRDPKGMPWQRRSPEPKRWYCQEPYKSAHANYRRIFDFLLEEFLVVVSIICFLDVFVTFFTGEVDELTGELVPKPFFARWIAPGLALQLLVNPRLGVLAKNVVLLGKLVAKVGPVRVIRWTATAIFPVIYFLCKYFIKLVWIPLVHHQNELDG